MHIKNRTKAKGCVGKVTNPRQREHDVMGIRNESYAAFAQPPLKYETGDYRGKGSTSNVTIKGEMK